MAIELWKWHLQHPNYINSIFSPSTSNSVMINDALTGIAQEGEAFTSQKPAQGLGLPRCRSTKPRLLFFVKLSSYIRT